MKIQEKDFYHGAVLAQIVEHQSFKALNRVDDSVGHYQVNHDTRLYTKYCTAGSPEWSFTFHPHELALLREDVALGVRLYLCLVCGAETICCLPAEALRTVLQVERGDSAQFVRVTFEPGCSMRVRGTNGTLPGTVPHNRFPKTLF